jgi:hypothetical protein
VVTVYEPKPRFRRLLRPLVGRSAPAGVRANQVTLVANRVRMGRAAAAGGR